MEKIYILDTNVLIQAPYAVECFEENEVVLPMTVLEELDNLKKEEGEKGANVRRVIRILDAYREKGNLLEGVYTGHGGILRVEKNYLNVELPEDLPDHKSDNRILKVCIGLSKESPSDPCDKGYSSAYQSAASWNPGRGLYNRTGGWA